MNRTQPIKLIKQIGEEPDHVFFAYLSEDYDGIGQYIPLILSAGSTSVAPMARIAAGDFGTGQSIPAGTKVSVMSRHGHLEILSMGVK